MGNSGSSTNSTSACVTSVAGKGNSSSGSKNSKNARHSSPTVLGTLSNSVASSLTTDDTNTTSSAEQSSNSSLETSNQSHHSVANEEGGHHVRRSFYDHRQLNCSRNRAYCSNDSLNDVDFLVDAKQQQQQQILHDHSFSDGMHTASSFELLQPECHGGALFLRALPEVLPSMLPVTSYRPHSVLGLSEQLHHSMSSCASESRTTASSTTSSSCCSSSEHYSEDSCSHYSRIDHNQHNLHPHPHDHNKHQARRPAFAQQQDHLEGRQEGRRKGRHSKESAGIRVAVMPLPRSKSFHQILRPTANGHILASNGTIRGASKQKLQVVNGESSVEVQQTLQPLASRVKQLFGQANKDYSSKENEKVSGSRRPNDAY